jgi:endonuclease/exonuclease/phosphatase family metal-dependent hydrolase
MAKSIRVASFNAENLLHPGVYFAGRPDDAPYDEELFERKARWISSILDEGRVDLAGFQEVFSVEALKRAVQRSTWLKEARVYAPNIANGENLRRVAEDRIEASGPFVALATHLPVEDVVSISEFPSDVDTRIPLEHAGQAAGVANADIRRFERPVLKARVLLPNGRHATVLVAHLKSKRGKLLEGEDKNDPLVQALSRMRSLVVRAAEAVALRSIITKLLDGKDGEAGEAVILLGDLNDHLTSVTTQLIAGEEPSHRAPRPQKLRQWDTLLYSAHDLQQAQSYKDVAYTHIFNGRYELLDHVFVSQELVRAFPNRFGQVAQTRIFNDHLVDERWIVAEEPVLAGKEPRRPSARSDHGVPVTEIELLAPSQPAQ